MSTDAGEPTTLNEAGLAARFRHDPAQFAAVYDEYFSDIYRYIAGRLGRQAADDVAADTFVTAFGQRDRFDPDRGTVRVWLYGIATNMVARHRRLEARRYAALGRAGTGRPADSHENDVVT